MKSVPDSVLDKQFPGNNLTLMPLGRSNDLASCRLVKPSLRGLPKRPSVHTVPWVPSWNADIFDSRLELASTKIFDRASKDEMEKYRKLLIEAARSGSESKRAREVAAYRLFELTNDVMASQFAMVAFQNINLSAEELPAIIRPRSKNLQRFQVRSIGQDGGARQDQIRTTKDFESMDMEFLSSDKVEYPLYDIQQGKVEGVEIANRDMRYDFDMHLDKLAQDNIDAAEMDSGLRDLLNIHPLIDPLNLPDKNHLDLTSEGNVGKLTIGKFKIILDHMARMGAVGGDGGVSESLTMQSFVMSPQNIRDPWDFVSMVSGFSGGDEVEPADTVPSSVRDSIFNTGMFASAWGQNFSWLPNGRISKGKAYVFTNQPLGWFFTKTEFDEVFVWDGPTQREQNYGQTQMRRCLRFVTPDLWRHRVLIIEF